MKAIKNLYVIITLVTLMLFRLFATGGWFGSIVVAGLLVTWVDTIAKTLEKYSSVSDGRSKARYGRVLLFMILVGAGLLILIVVNFVQNLEWLNLPLVLDEFTLAALLVCLSQDTVIRLIGIIIGVSHKE